MQVEETENVLLRTARQNIKHYLDIAQFKCRADHDAAKMCVEVLVDEIDGLTDLVAVLRSAIAADHAIIRNLEGTRGDAG